MIEFSDYLRDRLLEHFGEATVVIALREAGFDARAHVATDILLGSEKIHLFLKFLRPFRQTAEFHVYNHVLPLLSIRTPRFYGSFLDYEHPTRWLILERVSGRSARPDRQADVIRIFHVLGRLHGQATVHPPLTGQGTDGLHFPTNPAEAALAGIRATLVDNLKKLGLDRRIPDVFDRCIEYLCAAPRTWIHGDPNETNMLMLRSGVVCLIDWEFSYWAPPAIDLGDLCACTPISLIEQGLHAYCGGYNEASGENIGRTEVEKWIDHGVFFRYAKILAQHGQPVGQGCRRDEWLKTNGVLLADRMNQLIACRGFGGN